MEKKEKDSVSDYIGCGFTTLIGFCIYGGICMFMFWLCMQCTGTKL